MRATLLFSFVAVALPLAAQTPPSPPAPPPAPAAKRTVELTGLALVNGFFTNARVNNSDVPQFADSLPSASAIGGTIRQTRLGLLLTDPDVLRGSFSGEVDVDFYGGQQPSSGGRTFPLLRLRRAVGIVSRSEEHTSELQSLAYLVCRLLLEKKKKAHGASSHSALYSRR